MIHTVLVVPRLSFVRILFRCTHPSAPTAPRQTESGTAASTPMDILLPHAPSAYPIPRPEPINARMIRMFCSFHLTPFASKTAYSESTTRANNQTPPVVSSAQQLERITKADQNRINEQFL